MINTSAAFVTKINPLDVTDLNIRVSEALQYLNVKDLLSSSHRVYIKPNFTYPFYKEGVTTSPEVIEATVSYLREFTSHIVIVESDGGFHAWKAEEAFAGHRIPEICQRYGIESANLTKLPREVATTEIAGYQVSVELATPMLRECDLFITMPVPKVHVMTGVSLASKNQWGCIPDVKRLRHHPDFAFKVLAINRLLRTRLVVFDGTYFLDRTGPMEGDAVPMNLLIAADDPGAGSLVCCEIMGVNPDRIEHLKLAQKVGMMPSDLRSVRVNTDPASFRTHQFSLKRTWLNYIALAAFRSRSATWFLYDSAFAKPVHDLLYVIRGRPEDVTPQW